MIVNKFPLPVNSLGPVSSILNDNSWETISKVSIAGLGDAYWDIGDCKEITLNGTVGTLSLSNVKLCVFILDFNHPINKTTADNNIIWGGFKTALTGGVDVALVDSWYLDYKSNGTKIFNMNHWGGSSSPYNTNYGGWKGCDFRYDILGGTSTAPSVYGRTKTTSTVGYDATSATISSPVQNTLMAALPSDLRAVLRLWNRYIDYKGNKSDTDANCSTATVDAISLLAEYEIYGSRTYANSYEQDHQKQMTYYANGNSKVKYRHSNTKSTCEWRCASNSYYNASFFLRIYVNGTVATNSSRISDGIAPAFRT